MEERDWQRIAWVIYHVTAPYRKEGAIVRPDDFNPLRIAEREKRERAFEAGLARLPETMTEEEMDAWFERVRARW